MKRLFGSLVVAVSVAAPILPAQAAKGNPPPPRYVAERVLVQTRPGLSTAELDKILKAHGGKRKEVIKQINVHVIDLPPQANAVAVAEALRKNKHVKFAEVDGVVDPSFYPDDPQYVNAWHLPKIGAPSAWDSGQGNGVTIAVIDTGVDPTHPDLEAHLVPGWNFYDNNSDSSDVAGHGTGVAGIAAAIGNNGVGVTSVGMRSNIMPLRVTDPSANGYYSLIAKAITFAADKGARVANVSFLGVSLSSTVESAAQYMRSKGGVVVTSAGNTGALRDEPQSSALTVVSATDSADAKASFSSYGDYVDLGAPGVKVYTTARGGSYAAMSGTSASSPVVAGVYALLLSAKSGLTPSALDDILFTTSVDLGAKGKDQEFGYGRVDAASAMQKALGTSTADTQAPQVAIITPGNNETVSGLVAVDAMADDNLGVTKVELYATNTLVATDIGAPYGFTLDTSPYGDGPLELVTKAYDAAGNVGTSSTVTVRVGNDTVPPTVQILNPSNGSTVSGTFTISVSATDDKNVSKIVLRIDGKEVANSFGSTLSYSTTAPTAEATGSKGKGGGGGGKGGGKKTTSATTGSMNISAEAFDAAGNSKSASVTVYY